MFSILVVFLLWAQSINLNLTGIVVNQILRWFIWKTVRTVVYIWFHTERINLFVSGCEMTCLPGRTIELIWSNRLFLAQVNHRKHAFVKRPLSIYIYITSLIPKNCPSYKLLSFWIVSCCNLNEIAQVHPILHRNSNISSFFY